MKGHSEERRSLQLKVLGERFHGGGDPELGLKRLASKDIEGREKRKLWG